jgi:hypothetical protein
MRFIVQGLSLRSFGLPSQRIVERKHFARTKLLFNLVFENAIKESPGKPGGTEIKWDT